MILTQADIERCKWVAARNKPVTSSFSYRVLRVVRQVSVRTGVSVDVIISGERTAAASYARDLACYLASKNGSSVKQIADTLHRHRTTIQQAIVREKARRGE